MYNIFRHTHTHTHTHTQDKWKCYYSNFDYFSTVRYKWLLYSAVLSIVFILNLYCFYNHGENCFIKIALFYKHIFCPQSFPKSTQWSQHYGFDKKCLPHPWLLQRMSLSHQWTLCCCPQNSIISHHESLPVQSLHLRTLLAEMRSELSRPVNLGQKDRRITVLKVTGSAEAEILQNREDKTAGPILWTQRDQSHGEEDARDSRAGTEPLRGFLRSQTKPDACTNFGFPVLHSNNTPHN